MKDPPVHLLLTGLVTCFGLTCLLAVTAAAQEFPRERAEKKLNVQLKIHILENASSAEMLKVLRPLFDQGEIRMTADARTNTLIVKGSADILAGVQALVLKLDEPSTGKSKPSARPQRVPPGRWKQTDSAPPQAKRSARRSPETISICSPLPGVGIVRSLVPDGTHVKKGDVLVTLDASRLPAEKERLEMELEMVKSDLGRAEQELAAPSTDVDVLRREVEIAKLRRGQLLADSKLELMTLKGEIALAEENLKLAEHRLRRIGVKAAQGGNANKLDVDAAASELSRIRVEHELAGAKGKVLVEHTQKLQSAEIDLEVRRAELAVERAERERTAHRAGAEAQVAAARAKYELTAAKLSRVAEQVAKCRVVAPAAGTVRYSTPRTGVRVRLKQKGVVVREGQRLLDLELDSPGAQVKQPPPSEN